jgi:hypothetical protein
VTYRSRHSTFIVSRSFPGKWRAATNCSKDTSLTHIPSRMNMMRLARSSRSINERDDSAKHPTGLPATMPAMVVPPSRGRLEKVPGRKITY